MTSGHWEYDREKVTTEAEELADQLSSSGAITLTQAEVYALREIYSIPRKDTAEILGKAPSTVDNLLVRAREKVKASQNLLNLLSSWDEGQEARLRQMDKGEGKMPEELGNPRKRPEYRKHETYMESDHWTVLDMSGVDNLFVADLTQKQGEIRIDMDGFIEPSSDVGKEGDNVNVSAWIPLEKAKELRDQLDKALD